MSMTHRVSLPAVLAAACMGIQSHAAIISYQTTLSGLNESPPNASPGTGLATLDYDNVLHSYTMSVTFTGLLGTTTASHTHAATAAPGTGTAGVATQTPYFPGFPIGVTSGSYTNTFDMTLASSWNSAFITANGGTPAGAEAAFVAALNAGKAYLNIHSTVVPGGEIRGFWQVVPAPTPIAPLGLAGLAVARRRRA